MFKATEVLLINSLKIFSFIPRTTFFHHLTGSKTLQKADQELRREVGDKLPEKIQLVQQLDGNEEPVLIVISSSFPNIFDSLKDS